MKAILYAFLAAVFYAINIPATTMITAAVATYVLASAAGVVLRRIPFIGRFIVG